MRDAGEALAGKFGIGCRLVPTHSADRVLRLVLRVGAEFPRRRPRATSGITESAHCFLPRNFAAVLDKWLFQEFTLAVAALPDKRFELAVRQLEFVQPEPGKSAGPAVDREAAGGNAE